MSHDRMTFVNNVTALTIEQALNLMAGTFFSIVQGKKLIYVFTNSKGVSISVKIGSLIILGFEG